MIAETNPMTAAKAAAIPDINIAKIFSPTVDFMNGYILVQPEGFLVSDRQLGNYAIPGLKSETWATPEDEGSRLGLCEEIANGVEVKSLKPPVRGEF